MNERSFDADAPAKAAAKPRSPRARGRKAEPAAESANRQRILDAAEKLFSTQGFHGTGLREIADLAGVSLGNIYNHFATKEKLFEALLDELEARYLDPSQPLPRALMELDFTNGVERLGEASRETVDRFASYIRLIYVDVIEFQGVHVARLYGSMKARYDKVFAERTAALKAQGVLGDADPVIGVMMLTIVYMYYFTVERLFGVKRHYGVDDDEVIRQVAQIFRHGVLKR